MMKKTLLGISLSLSLALAYNTQEISGFQSPESVYATNEAVFVSNLGKEVKPHPQVCHLDHKLQPINYCL